MYYSFSKPCRVPSAFLLLSSAIAFAQLSPPNEVGVAMGHLHMNVKDLAQAKKFWVDGIGAAPAGKLGNNEVYRMVDAKILVRQMDGPLAGSAGSAVDHLGFKVKNLKTALDRLKAAGFPVIEIKPGATQAFVATPEGVRVELSEDPAMKTAVAHHHIHFATQSVDAMKVWYVNTFGAIGGKRGRFEAADIPGGNLSFNPSDKPLAPTKGRSLDHIGFEVKNLEAFTKKLQGRGLVFDVPYRNMPQLGIALAFLTDPFGTYIELTEGLNK